MSRPRTPRRARPETPIGSARLWAPWRSAYLRTVDSPARGCIFCFGKLAARTRRSRLILYAGPHALVMLNRYPYNNGHLMIAPRRHLASPELLDKEERAAIGELLAESVVRLRRALNPAGLNLGANLGRSAGAGIADHMHWHVVPRWEGDTNFMPVFSGARVLSQHLEESFNLLEPLFKTVGAAIS